MPIETDTSAPDPARRPRLRHPPLCIEKPPRPIPFVRPVWVQPMGGEVRVPFTAATLSKVGMFVCAAEPLPAGTEVELFLEAGGRVLRFGSAIVSLSVSASDATRFDCIPGFRLGFQTLPTRSQALVHRLIQLVDGAAVRDATASSARTPIGELAGRWNVAVERILTALGTASRRLRPAQRIAAHRSPPTSRRMG